MTKEEFNNLDKLQQEDFINSGGVLSSTDVPLIPVEDRQQEGPKEADGFVATSSVEAKEDTEVTVSSPPATLYTNGFDIRDPVELLYLLDDTISSGKVRLHDWQTQFLLDFAEGGIDDSHPFQALVRACNGSGKDKYILAPSVVWLCMRHYKARGIVTSSSGVQLNNQTCAYITQLAESANRKYGPIWKCNYRYYLCLATESPIICYATDEPGKAEGFHPLEYGAKMGIFESEGKTVPDEIYIAQNKCTGYTHRISVSTPGAMYGHFYDLCSTAVDRKSIKKVSEVKAEDYIQYHITAADCSHLRESYINQMKRDLPGGEHGAAFKSQVLAEFGTTDEMVVIPYTYIWKARHKPISEWIGETYNKAGLDLSDGGDETVLAVRNGNRLLATIPFRFDNTEDTVAFLEQKFREYDLVNANAYIFADCGGIGKPILDRLKRKGWVNIRYCDNRHKSIRPKTYRNWGAESWFNLGELLKRGEIILNDDASLLKQLSSRYYKIIDGAIHQLLSKIEMRSRGHKSPDRADAVVLAFSDYKSNFTGTTTDEKPFKVEEVEDKKVNDFNMISHCKGEANNYRDKYVVNENQKDFSELQLEVADYNRTIKLKG